MRSHTMSSAAAMVVIALVSGAALAETNATATSYYTDFAGDVSADFCGGSIAEYQPDTSHSQVTFADGSLTLSGRYGSGNSGVRALIAGGSQLLNSENNPISVQIGEDGVGDPIMSEAYGVFFDTNVEITYTLLNPTVDEHHKDIRTMIGARHNDGPWEYRLPSYTVSYDGVRLSVGEWTYKYQAPIREIAGMDVAAATDDGTFKLILSVTGGDDNDGADGTPATLHAELWENGGMLASLDGVDNPYDYINGPEVAGATFDPAADYGVGGWNPYAGDWHDEQSWSRGNDDIRPAGWVELLAGQTGNSGTYKGMVISELAVNVVDAPAVLLGDANNDGVVSADDFAAVQTNFGNTGAADGLLPGDANDDGVVSADDFAAIQTNFGNVLGAAAEAAPVPEPATMALLAIGGLAATFRKRRD